MPLGESLKFRAQHPDYVLPSRFLDKWKGNHEGSVDAKSRVVILGFKDPPRPPAGAEFADPYE